MKIDSKNSQKFKDMEILRSQMMKSGANKGLLDSETIRYSQQLDQLIFKYQSKKDSFK